MFQLAGCPLAFNNGMLFVLGKVLNGNYTQRIINFPISFTHILSSVIGFGNKNQSVYAYMEIYDITNSTINLSINCNSGSENLYSGYIVFGY